MQLTLQPRSATAVLALAVTRLLAAPAASAAGLDGLSVEQATLVYQEQGRIAVVEPVLQLRLPLPGEQSLGLRYGFDAMSGASPNGRAPAVTWQTFTTPSGHTRTTAAGNLPTNEFRDQRHSVALDWERPLGHTLRLTSGANASFETDYRSLGASLSAALDLNQRLTTLTLGASFSEDRVEPKGGIKAPLELDRDAPATASAEAKHIVDGLVGLTQVMNRHWLTTLNLGLGRDGGYLTDPYKVVSLVDGQGQPVMETGNRPLAAGESRPDSRTRSTLYWGNAIHLGRDVLHADLRHYRDDWGVTANTVDLQLWMKPQGLPGWRFRPQLRWSGQGRADFYVHSISQTAFAEGPPRHLSADSRLADMTSWTAALRVDLPASRWGQLWVKPAWMTQRYDLAPAPVGVQADVDLVPDLNVWMLTLGFRTTL